MFLYSYFEFWPALSSISEPDPDHDDGANTTWCEVLRPLADDGGGMGIVLKDRAEKKERQEHFALFVSPTSQ